jgi:ligand-binding SRPBCC domain-containing protein
MAKIHLETKIKAPAERCFLLSLSVDLHTGSTAKTGEKAVAGVTRGLMNLNDTVTWEAKHFGIVQRFTSRISAYEKPTYFISEMQKGAFKKFRHQHFFKQEGDYCLMKDELELQSPFGIFGKIADALVMKNYIKKFLVERNQFIKRCAETDAWKEYLS